MKGYDRIPRHMREALRLWLEQGQPHPELLESFLLAVLTNDLIGAFAHADDVNTFHMRDWTLFIYNDAPGGSWGTISDLVHWHEIGGLHGLLNKSAEVR